MAQKIKIGYLCSKGHFQFDGDPEGDSCGTKDIAEIYVKPRPWVTKEITQEIVNEALTSIWVKLTYWRHG